ncbi:uncharacterized protein LOC108631650 [Ceratina calcarata]|uniref:Uncharacterized protein LOC108631650 n=1 Tax=Ceratina calcarata TaxID=156304 RepID=A0AAJ7SBC9_9HYME|nr:uncharacterized protein LOC108631650 [Ceratina calcarata]
MSERKVEDTEILRKRYTNDASLEPDIIDVSAIDFDDADTWLYVPPQGYRFESTVQDLYTWLRTEPELFLSVNKKPIDSRTFTRTKKRSSKCSFESILESLSSPISNTWRTFSNVEEDLGKYSNVPTASKEETVPAMLRTAAVSNASFLIEESTAATTSGQESMEVFLNMSHSKGMDSFINSMEPGFSDPLMNVSQPSILYSSITSMSREEDAGSTVSPNQITDNHEDAETSYTNEQDNNDRTFTNKELTDTYDADTTVVPVNKFSTINLSSTFVQNDDDANPLKNARATDTTYCSTNVERGDDGVSPFLNDTKTDELKNVEPSSQNDDLNATFKLPMPPTSKPKTVVEALNSTFRANKHLESSRVHDMDLNSTFKMPTLLRKELLSEIYKNRDHRLNCTYDQDEKPEKKTANDTFDVTSNENIPVDKKYSTYKKGSPVRARPRTEDEAGACTRDTPDKRYYTFTKRAGSQGKIVGENTGSLDNVDAMFVKPLPKRKQHIPRMLSKLPQFLQKSNPNLVSNSLRPVSSLGYAKGSQPNVRDVEKVLASKLYLGKMRSGSEQRLVELNKGVGDQILSVGGSTESIESTQSAHSAPDLDDRLSTCSDCSHSSYTTQPMNVEQLQQVIRMQEESLNQDAPLRPRRVLENTWPETRKDLPSPISKNGIDSSDRVSPLSMDYDFQTSSPIISPTRSSQSINADGQANIVLNQRNEADVTRNIEIFNKPATKLENKTKLRQPTNWNAGNRASSGIPRPPSRIPAPRFSRPAARNTQGDVKRGYT